jgi:hypothetical protein
MIILIMVMMVLIMQYGYSELFSCFVIMPHYFNTVARAWQEPCANDEWKTKWNGKKHGRIKKCDKGTDSIKEEKSGMNELCNL